ncbi:MAG: non-canonical purine NTP pyrophosphatase [Chloroflexi bacterium]|nr:non-canonical purine NTP pyrophosphatase [Chloroflexota bacterium]
MSTNQIVFFTSNPAKLKEAEQAFRPFGIEIISHNFDFLEIQSDSQEAVLRDKVNQVQGKETRPYLVDDSGFYLEAYPEFPGVNSKFVYQTIHYAGILRLLPSSISRRAYFRAVIGLNINGQVHVFEGRCDGIVPEHERGETQKGFLFEPIFVPDGSTQTMAEMSPEERKRFSYRAAALEKAAQFVSKL